MTAWTLAATLAAAIRGAATLAAAMSRLAASGWAIAAALHEQGGDWQGVTEKWQGPLLRSCRRAQARSQATATAWEAVGSTTSCIADTSSACRCTLTRRSGLHSKQRLGARLEQRYAAAFGDMERRTVGWLLVRQSAAFSQHRGCKGVAFPPSSHGACMLQAATEWPHMRLAAWVVFLPSA